MEENRIFFFPYVLDLIHLLEQKNCRDSNLRVKTMVKSGLKNHFEIPPCGKMVIFVTEFVILRKTHPFYEVLRFVTKF